MTSPAPDAIAMLERLAVIHAGRLRCPADLSAAVAAWVAEAAGQILSGEHPAAALGLATAPGARSLGRQSRQAQRDRCIAELLAHAPGSSNAKADRVLEWLEAGADRVPATVAPVVKAALSVDLPLPTDLRSIQRAAARAARAGAVNTGADREILASSAACCGQEVLQK